MPVQLTTTDLLKQLIAYTKATPPQVIWHQIGGVRDGAAGRD
jgi:uncharacterized protein (DUF779 family)